MRPCHCGCQACPWPWRTPRWRLRWSGRAKLSRPVVGVMRWQLSRRQSNWVMSDRLCEACVTLLDVDAAAISLVFDGANTGTLGSSGEFARVYDELQFTLGEGPCLESVSRRAPVLVTDLADGNDRRWPVYGPAMLDHRIRGVYAMPVVVAGEYVGALDLFRVLPGQLGGGQLAGSIVAAELAGMPLLDLLDSDMKAAVSDPGSNAWAELNALSRAEV